MLELAAALDVVAARRQRDFLVDLLLGLGHEAAHVAAADVGRDGDPPLAPFARDRRRPFDDLDVGQPRQRNPLAGGRRRPGSRRSPRGRRACSSGSRTTSGNRNWPSITSPSGLLPIDSTRSSTASAGTP